MKAKKALTILFSTCFILAFMLGVFALNFISNKKTAFATEEIPTAYQNDYKNLTYASSVRNQGSTGMCWAFSAVAAAEIDAVKNHGANKSTIDLSEWHLAYFLYHGERVGTGDTVTYTNKETPYYSIGGNDIFTAYALSNWIGFADESVAPFTTLQNNLNATISQDKMNETSYKINNVHIFDVATDSVEMKKAIMEYGAITLSYNQSTAYLNSSTYSQYCPSEVDANHMVTVVGFDDNYARENFSFLSRPSKDGAWLVRNSWGDNWGLDGYFWLSYEDKSISTAAAIDVIPASTYSNNYHHDGGISATCLTHAKGVSSSYANAFTATSKEVLKAVGVYVYGVADGATSEEYNYTIRIYKNPKSLNPSTFNFNFGTPVSTVSGAFKSIGFLTIPLTNELYLEYGDTFVIEVETCAFVGIDMTTDIQASTSNGVEVLANSLSGVERYQSYVKNGSTWRDTYNNAEPYNFRIKGFTVTTEVGETVIESAPIMSASISYGEKLTDNLLSGGKVVDGDTNEQIDGVWSFKDKNAIAYSGQQIEVVFTPTDSRYQSVDIIIYANVKKTKPTLKLSEVEDNAYLGANIHVSAVAENPYNSALNDFNTIRIYYQIDGGVKNEVFNNSFTVPNGMLDGSTITFSAECNSDAYKYQTADIVTKTITVKSQYRISETPTASSVVFGKKLSSSQITGGVVLDTSLNEQVEGVWRFSSENAIIGGETSVRLEFYKTGENTPLLGTFVVVTTIADKPEIIISVDKSTFVVGDKVNIVVELKNKHNDSAKDFGKYTLYYIIGDSNEMVKISETKGFVVPSDARGKIVTIVVVTEGVDGKYIASSNSVKISVLSGLLADCFSTQLPTKLCVFAMLPAVVYLVVKGVRKSKER